MKALVLAGGSGTRLRPFSHSMPKQLIPLANRPVLEYALATIAATGVTDIGVVVGDRADQIAAVIGDGSRLGVRVTYVRQDRPLGLAHAVKLARPVLGDDDFVLYLGDNVLPDGIAAAAARFRRTRPAAQVLVQAVADPRRFGVAELAPDGTVRRLVEKPPEPTSDLALIGTYFFTAAIHQAVAAIAPSGRGEWEITDAIQWLLEHGAEVHAVEYDGHWMDIGRVEDVLECNRRLLDDLRARTSGQVDADSEIGPDVVVEAGARVVRSRVTGPAIIGADSVVEDSDIGPYVSIGRECVVRATTVAESIVLDQASIVDGGRLRDSVIGRSATVDRFSATTSHHRLLVGDHGEVHIGG